MCICEDCLYSSDCPEAFLGKEPVCPSIPDLILMDKELQEEEE